MFNITVTRVIDAPDELVWEVLTDLDSYGNWNKYVVECSSTLEINSPITLKLWLLPFFISTVRETVFEHIPGKVLYYGLPIPFGAVNGGSRHSVLKLESGKTEYTRVYEITGWASSLVGLIMNRQFERGFSDMADGIQDRALCLKDMRERTNA
jgi:hypothetical protein